METSDLVLAIGILCSNKRKKNLDEKVVGVVCTTDRTGGEKLFESVLISINSNISTFSCFSC